LICIICSYKTKICLHIFYKQFIMGITQIISKEIEMIELGISKKDAKSAKKCNLTFTVDSDFSEKFNTYLEYRGHLAGFEITKSALVRKIFMKFFDENPAEIAEAHAWKMGMLPSEKQPEKTKKKEEKNKEKSDEKIDEIEPHEEIF